MFMKLLMVIGALITILQSFRVSICFLRKDISNIKKIFEMLLLIIMLVLSNNNLQYYGGKVNIYFSIILSLYILIAFIYERMQRKEYISVLSVKNGIDMADTGIMFLNNQKEIILINNLMMNILTDLNIKDNYINKLMCKSIRKTEDDYIIKSLNKIWNLKITDEREIVLIDVTNIYKLQEEKELQNQEIEENNKKILETIQNIEKIEKTKNLLKIKNNYHDKLGHKLALFTKYLERKEKNVKNIEFLLDSIYDDNMKLINSSQKLNDLIKMYDIIGININIKGELPQNKNESNVFFEIIREAVTNAIIHADSKNISVIITKYLDRVEMIITNDGKKNNGIIYENEGIRGMRRKLSEIKGNLVVDNKDKFTLRITV